MQIEKFPPVTCRYCPNLDSNVVILHKQEKAGDAENVCLHAHLCAAEVRRFCPHHREKNEIHRYYF